MTTVKNNCFDWRNSVLNPIIKSLVKKYGRTITHREIGEKLRETKEFNESIIKPTESQMISKVGTILRDLEFRRKPENSLFLRKKVLSDDDSTEDECEKPQNRDKRTELRNRAREELTKEKKREAVSTVQNETEKWVERFDEDNDLCFEMPECKVKIKYVPSLLSVFYKRNEYLTNLKKRKVETRYTLVEGDTNSKELNLEEIRNWERHSDGDWVYLPDRRNTINESFIPMMEIACNKLSLF